MSKWNLAWLLALPALTAAAVLALATAPPPDPDYQLVRTVVDVLGTVDQNYVRELNEAEKRKLVEAMIAGGLARLDPHSQYLPASDYAQFLVTTDGQFGGIGVQLLTDPATGLKRVESLVAGTPAYDAGIQAGEFILRVNGKVARPMTVEELRKEIKGAPGSPVTLTMSRDGDKDEREVKLERAMIEVHPVQGYARSATDPNRWEWFADPENKIALVRLTTFSEKSDKEVREAVLQAEAAGARALILDMRDNLGGLLTQAAAVADLFLTEGPIVSTATKRTADGAAVVQRTLSAKAEGTIFEPASEKPMAVLINDNSASASEIVAAALQDHHRAVLVGERSYGKGSVQKVFPLNGNAALKLTTEVWLTPAGKNIHRWPDSKPADEWGCRPDPGLEVKLSESEAKAYFESRRRLDMVRGKPTGGVVPAPVPVAGAAQPKDVVLEKALVHLRTVLAMPKGA